MIGRWSGHLGTKVSALADGQLAPAEADRALAHVAECPACAAELAAARAVRSALRQASDEAPAASEALTLRLLALGGPTAGRATGGSDTPSEPGDGATVRGGLSLPTTGAPAWRPTVRTALVLVGAAGGALTLGVLAALGAAHEVVPSRHPADALALLSTAEAPSRPEPGGAETAVASQDDVHAWMRAQGWHAPAALPEGLAVAEVNHDDVADRLEIHLETPDGPVVVVQRHGRLDPETLPGAEAVRIDGVEVHVISVEPWHGVWQCGDTVVDVVSARPSDALRTLISAYPADGYDDGVPARIARGWDSLVGAWRP